MGWRETGNETGTDPRHPSLRHRPCAQREARTGPETHRKPENRKNSAPSGRYMQVLRIVSGAAPGVGVLPAAGILK